MKTIQVTVYDFDDLLIEAKENAVNNYFERMEYFWHDDNVRTLKAFCDLFNIDFKLIDFEYGYRKYLTNKNGFSDSLEQLRGLRLRTYILNNFITDKPKYIGWLKTKKKPFYSKIQRSRDCMLTGYTMDYDILQPLFDFIDKPNKATYINDIINECLYSWLNACQSDYDDYFSKENIINEIAENGITFDKNGNIYSGE